jgi:hypothetical protein
MTYRFHGYAFDYGTEHLVQPPDEVLVPTTEYWQLTAQHGLQQAPGSCIYPTEQTAQAYPQYGMTARLPTKVSAPEAAYGIEHTHMLPALRRISHVASFPGSSHEGLQTQIVLQQQQLSEQQHRQRYQQQQSSACKMACARSTHDHPKTHKMHAPVFSSSVCEAVAVISHGQNMPLRPQAHTHSSDLSATYSEFGHPGLLAQAHHHHRLPNYPPLLKPYRTEYKDDVYTPEKQGSQSVVGKPGMPKPAAMPKGLKVKFTPEEDALLVELKETKDLTWRQIADFFPGRSSGTLQVRYCTKLKATALVWTEDKVIRSWAWY